MQLSVTNKGIIKLAAPISLAILIPQLNFLTNTAFLGRLGERELAVNGLTGVFYLIISMVGYGLNSGIQAQMARRGGEGDNAGLGKTLTNGMLLGVMASLVLMILAMWLSPFIFELSLHDKSHVSSSINYLYIRVWGLPFLLLVQLMNAFYISTGQSRFLMYGSLAATVVNIVLDYFFIFGKAGFPEMGLNGAAVASVIAEVVYAFVMVGIFYFGKMFREFPVFTQSTFDTSLARRSLNVSAPLIVQYLFSIGGWQVFFIFVEHLGQRELAASQILRSVFGVVSVVTWAFASTCNTLVSNVIGQGKQNEVIPVIRKICTISFVCTAAICVPLLLFPAEFLSLYRDDASLIAMSLSSLRLIVVATLIMALSTVMFNGVVGTGNTMVNLIIEVACVGIYLVYCYIFIERARLPLAWAWGSEFVYWTSLFIISYLYLHSGRWKGKTI
ncbi:MAG: MATE family efflux transporter [Flavipsychrobacter sp.]|nr:MATE family efflux transporter [Flavipsychrobacter sp.]